MEGGKNLLFVGLCWNNVAADVSLYISEDVIASGLTEQWAAQDTAVIECSFRGFIKSAANRLSYMAQFITFIWFYF